MSDSRTVSEIVAAVAALHTDLDTLTTHDLTVDTDDAVLELWSELEGFRRRLAVVDHAVIAQVQTRHLDFERGATSVAVFAREVLRVPISEAKARVRAAEAAGPRTALTGEALPPIYAHVAAAQAEGAISAAHAAVVVKTIEALPPAVQEPKVEEFLVEQARIFDPDTLGKLAAHLSLALDPDGRLKDVEDRHRRRDLALHRRPDGSGRLVGELTAEAAEHLDVLFDTLARPVPETEAVKDPRTAGQRRHDALLDGIKLVERAELLPAKAGVTATVILVASEQDWAAGTGTTRTGHGATLPTSEAKQWVDGHAKIVPLGARATRRYFTERHRLHFIARDGGCSFPGCDRPPQHCESHHVVDHCRGGPTDTTNGTLLCGYHHREFQRLGWRCDMTTGLPLWTPPRWIDRSQTPRRNHMHHPAAA